jgi:hypothetical protein
MSQPTLTPPAPALAEIEEALVRALIVEKLEDGSYNGAGTFGADANGWSGIHPAARASASRGCAIYHSTPGFYEMGCRVGRVRPRPGSG